MATPVLSINCICNPITCNVGLHTGATDQYTSRSSDRWYYHPQHVVVIYLLIECAQPYT